MSDTVIFWFQRDLRLADNLALLEASKQGSVLPVYILDDREEFKIGGASKWWLHHSLEALKKSLDNQLVFFKGDATKVMPQLVQSAKAKAVYWNRCYEPAFIRRDVAIEKVLSKQEIECHAFEGTMLWEPDSVAKKDGTSFKVYTPFLRACLAAKPPKKPEVQPKKLKFSSAKPENANQLSALGLLPAIPWDEGIKKVWEPGEEAAEKMLQSFVTGKLEHYGNQRNFPSHDVLSRLSPYLHYGDISPNQVWHAVCGAGNPASQHNENINKFISEMCWRDFSYNVLMHFPETAVESYNQRLKKLKWHYDLNLLKKWQQGQTGFPIIDAGMRQLWQTGYMHNRVRMLTASFLVKNLLIDWRKGADWFLDCLVDADLAVNTMNWQWVAGSGLDAAPFFRIFNPLLQSKKFDLEGEYIKMYVPELKELPAKYIHEPWTASASVLNKANLKIGKDYPNPCIDLKSSAQQALKAYQATS